MQNMPFPFAIEGSVFITHKNVWFKASFASILPATHCYLYRY
jgi:hypothetical protein